MKAKKNSTPRVPCPKGTHIAILFGIIDYGTQTDKFGSRRKVEFLWETPEETHEFSEERGEEPFIIDRKFALTIGRKSALKECLEGMSGEQIEEDELDLEPFLGKVCMMTIAHEADGEYTNLKIVSISPLSKTDAKRKFRPHNDLILLDLDNFDEEAFKSLPEWKRDIIAKSPEYKEAAGEAAAASKGKDKDEDEDDRPARKPVKKAAAAPPKKAPAKAKAGDLFSRKKK